MESIYHIINVVLPFEWAGHAFMKNALLAIVLAAPLFGAMGSMVLVNRMTFFSDALGHGAFTGVAIGAVMGFAVKPTAAALLFSIAFAVLMCFVKRRSQSGGDTVIGVFSSTAAALGIALLSRGRSFSRYASALSGDILSVAPRDLIFLAGLFVVVAVVWYVIANKAFLSAMSESIACSRGVNPFIIETAFTVILAALVSACVSWIGLLLVNSFLVLPAAAARLLAKNLRGYHAFSVLIALGCGVAGLIVSYYFNIATAASMVMLCAVVYFIAFVLHLLPGRGS